MGFSLFFGFSVITTCQTKTEKLQERLNERWSGSMTQESGKFENQCVKEYTSKAEL